jgi:hypothetical protein
MKTHMRFGWLLALVAGAASTGLAVAGDHRYTASNPVWKAECGSCHIAYPPQLLPASAWRALMSGLDRHFDTDASLDAQSAAEITSFLEQHAGRERAASGPPVLRISETRWFRHEHDEVPARVWTSPGVKHPSNCAACHDGADRGDFNEHRVRIPN